MTVSLYLNLSIIKVIKLGTRDWFASWFYSFPNSIVANDVVSSRESVAMVTGIDRP
jgi:hypothetical protein